MKAKTLNLLRHPLVLKSASDFQILSEEEKIKQNSNAIFIVNFANYMNRFLFKLEK